MNDSLPTTPFPRLASCNYGTDSGRTFPDCHGAKLPGQRFCLEHASDSELHSFLSSIGPGARIDFRHTNIPSLRLQEVLSRLKQSEGGGPLIGRCSFDDAHFTDEADFSRVTFSDYTSFDRATFIEAAHFDNAAFANQSSFKNVVALSTISFFEVTFTETPWFSRATFHDDVYFTWTTFQEDVMLDRTTFKEKVDFHKARFQDNVQLGPFIAEKSLEMEEVIFNSPMALLATARGVSLRGSRWSSFGQIELRHADVSLADCALEAPVSVRSALAQFEWDGTILEEDGFSNLFGTCIITDLSGTDCSMLTLADVELARCHFSGAIHLDQIRLEAHYGFNIPPQVRMECWRLSYKWTQRQVIEEERQWRALPERSPVLRRGWGAPPEQLHEVPSLAALAIIYRQLRKSREDAKDEPGAADFYYGEMEMRRHSKEWGTAERWLLQLYWLLSGYGLRASRALGCLALAMLTTILLMMGFGLPQDSPRQEASGMVPPGGGKVIFEIDKDDPKNPTHDRFTTKRFDKALSVTLNSVVFRSSGQDLTTAGGYIEMASRFSEPVLLGLAALAIRGRVKR